MTEQLQNRIPDSQNEVFLKKLLKHINIQMTKLKEDLQEALGMGGTKFSLWVQVSVAAFGVSTLSTV